MALGVASERSSQPPSVTQMILTPDKKATNYNSQVWWSIHTLSAEFCNITAFSSFEVQHLEVRFLNHT